VARAAPGRADRDRVGDGRAAVPVPARAGDLILWDVRLTHGNGVNLAGPGGRPRLAQYLSVIPAEGDGVTASRERRREAIDMWRRNRMPDSELGAVPERLRRWERGRPQARLTLLGRRLLGLVPWREPAWARGPVAATSAPGDLAYGRRVRASRAPFAEHPASAGVDGDPSGSWSAGSHPPQWFDIALDAPARIGRVRLVPSPHPDGETVHHLLGRPPGQDEWTTLRELRGVTRDGVPIECRLDPPPLAEMLRIETLEGPSWVSWRAIEVFGAP